MDLPVNCRQNSRNFKPRNNETKYKSSECKILFPKWIQKNNTKMKDYKNNLRTKRLQSINLSHTHLRSISMANRMFQSLVHDGSPIFFNSLWKNLSRPSWCIMRASIRTRFVWLFSKGVCDDRWIVMEWWLMRNVSQWDAPNTKERLITTICFQLKPLVSPSQVIVF